jgi:hypothetical protein
MPVNYSDWLKRPDYWRTFQELQHIDGYLDLLNIANEENKRRLAVAIEEFLQSTTTEEDHDNVADFFQIEQEEIERDFQLMFSGFVLNWYSFMETHLTGFCDKNKLKISVSIQDDISFQTGIRRARFFLRQAANYEINPRHWTELEFIGQVRNKIVHHNGKLPSLEKETEISVSEMDRQTIGLERRIYLNVKKEFYDYLKGYELLNFSGLERKWFYIIPNLNYCKHLVQFGIEFFDYLYKTFDSNRISIQ